MTSNHVEPPQGHRGLVAVDIAGFSRRERTEPIHLRLRAALYGWLETAMGEAGIAFDGCYWEDRGDGAILVLPPDASMSAVAGRFTDRLRHELRRHNATANDIGTVRLRVALHAGEVQGDEHGLVGAAVIHVFRLLDAPVVKERLAWTDGSLAVVASDSLYENVLRHGWDAVDPSTYLPVEVRSKETSTRAWITLPGAAIPATPSTAPAPPEPPSTGGPSAGTPSTGVHNNITGGSFPGLVIQAGSIGNITPPTPPS